MQEKLNVKEGDEVLRCGISSKSLLTVKKITPSGNIRTSDGRLFDPYGRLKGGDRWDFDSLKEYTGEAKEEYIRRSAIGKAHSLMLGCRKISYEQALEIIKILEGEDEV
ncbi:MAG: hypothetical protein ACRC3H_19625 [Lachnospiraceae bacterium]